MASSSENEESKSINNENQIDNTIFYDAFSSLTDLQKADSFCFSPDPKIYSCHPQSFTRFITVPLTESQLKDLACRDKLQRLRAREDQTKSNVINTLVNEFDGSFQLKTSSLNQSTISDEYEDITSFDESTSTHDLPNESSFNGHGRFLKKIPKTQRKALNEVETDSSNHEYFQHQRSLPYPTMPSSSSTRNTASYFSRMMSLSAMSEPNIVEINLLDHENNNEDFMNRRKFPPEDLFKPFLLNSFDHDKYVRSSDANPMTQTLLERAKGSNIIVTSRQNSSMNSTHSYPRRNSTDQESVESNKNLETSSIRKKYSTKTVDVDEDDEEDDDDDDNESTTSESSSTRSSHTNVISSPSTTAKSTKAAMRAASFLFHGGKRQLTRLMSGRFLRKNVKKQDKTNQQPADAEEDDDDCEKLLLNDGFNGDLKYKSSRILKDQTQFDKTQLLQTIVNAHHGPIWCMKFSPDGHLLATGGQDKILKVWVLKMTEPYFDDLSRITSNLSKQQNEILSNRFRKFSHTMLTETFPSTINTKLGLNEVHAPLYSRPFCNFVGHQAPVLDVAWSKSWFLLSSSMDKTVRLWHLSRLECLCAFRHVDFVSAIAFHPRDDRYFVSASLDGHVRLWNIPDKRVVYWALIPVQRSSLITAAQANLITSVHFCDEGRKVTVGTFDGRFFVYTDSLEYETVMNIGDKDGSRSHRSRKKCRKPYKITGIESMNSSQSRVLITSNDSRIRLYDTRSREIERKYRGYSNQSSQIRASFSHDDLYIISGSEDGWFYVWRTEPNSSINSDSMMNNNASATRKQQRQFGRAFERIRVHNTMVTSAIFTPDPNSIMDHLYSSMTLTTTDHSSMTNRSHMHNNSQNTSRPIPTMMGTITPLINNHHRTTRLICTHISQSPSETSSTSVSLHSNTYVMVTADAKGQMKLLVNRFIR